MMEGVTTAIVAFIFVCILYPRLVKNRAQFYAAFGLVIVMLLINSVAVMVGSAAFARFVMAIGGLLQLSSLVLLVTATGGLSLKDLAGEFGNAFEVIRRGEADKEVIIPLSGDMARPRRPVERRAVEAEDEDDGPVVHRIETPPPPPPPGATFKSGDSTSIPLE